jgi:ELWxxDGT repeat protein
LCGALIISADGVRALLGLVVLTGWYSAAFAQYFPILVKDIEPGGPAYPEWFTPVAGTLFFSAEDGTTGSELWKSDGTADGTVLVKDIWPGEYPSNLGWLTPVGGTLFFVADDGTTGSELWKSDGTADGTVLVKDIGPGSEGSYPEFLTPLGGTLFFQAWEQATGHELWKSDGTADGTVLVKDIGPGQYSSNLGSFTPVGGTLFFSADDGTTGSELWKSDGTADGTVFVKNIWPGQHYNLNWLTPVGGTLFFVAADETTTGWALWKSDGTADGTVLVKDIWPGQYSSNLGWLTPVGETLFFSANVGTLQTLGFTLWKSDGTADGTVLVKDMWPAQYSYLRWIVAVGGTLFFSGDHGPLGGGGTELWKSDGTADGTVLVKDIWPGSQNSNLALPTPVSGTLFFVGNDGITGPELWESDGTADGTVLVKDIWPGRTGSSPSSLRRVGGTLFFVASGTTGPALWRAVPAPVISVAAPTLVFPIVTVGDTSATRLEILNNGLTTLIIQNVQMPSSEMRHDRVVPFDIAPGKSDTLTFSLEPRIELDASGDVVLTTNDPQKPLTSIPVEARILDLRIDRTVVIPPVERVPLGQNVTVLVLPAPDVRIENGYVAYKATGAAFFDSHAILVKESGRDFHATIPGRFVTEVGLEYYVRVENSGILATDPPNAPQDSVFKQNVAPPTAITAVPQPTLGTDFLEAREIRVLVETPEGSQLVSGTLKYRRGGEGPYVSGAVDASGPLPVGVIPSEYVGARGVEYWVDVQTRTRNLTDPPHNPFGSPHSIPVIVSNVREGAQRAGETYRLLSMPLAMQGTIAGSVTDDVGGPDKTRWRMFAYEPAGQRYVEVPDEDEGLTVFEQGRAYWLITREAHRIDTGPDKGETARTDRAFEIMLEPGYNLVGNPFNFAVAWDSCIVDTFSVTDPAADARVQAPVAFVAGKGYVYDTPRLEPFNGYWVENKTSSPLVLRIPAVEAPASVAVEVAGEAGRAAGRPVGLTEGWRIQIRTSSSGLEDEGALVGIHADAQARRDPHDRSLPPMHPGRFVAVHFPHSDWQEEPGSYARDIRGDFERVEGVNAWGHAWRFDVAKSFSDETAGDDVVLEILGIDDLPDDARVSLVDRHLERLIDLRAESRYTFYQGERKFVARDEDARFVLLVGSEEFVKAQGSSLARVPTKTILHQNIPNPFNPSTIIRYELATTSRVDLRVYDVHGSVVRVLEDRDRPPGLYEVGWNGTNERGEHVASGVYFYRLKTSDFEQTKKLALLK